MKTWVSPKYSRSRVDAAGDTLINPSAGETEKDLALAVIGNWRSSHSYPLQALKMALRNRAHKVDSQAVVAQRLKRLTSIAAKLSRNPNMKLSQMQDIGGCRAVVRNLARLDRLVKLYAKVRQKNPNVRAEYVKPFDYIECPKVDGYRGVHLIYKYRSQSPAHKVWNGLRIEVQLRSSLQHAWATAVETVDAFTGQALKTSGGTGTEKKDWGRFFALMSSAIALREKRPLVPGTPDDEHDLLHELHDLSEQLKVEPKLRAWSFGMQVAYDRASDTDVIFLLSVDFDQRNLRLKGFSDIRTAQDAYLVAEKELGPHAQAVLVSVDSINAISAAYPNYFADTSAFLDVLEETIGGIDQATVYPIEDIPLSDPT